MSWISRIVNAFRPDRTAKDLDDELQFHLEHRADDLVRGGLARHEAELLARRQLGNSLQLRESSYDVKSLAWLDSLFRDVRIGARMLAKTPVFTFFAALVLAIGIGANITVFSLIMAIVTRPLDVPNADRLVRLYGNDVQRYPTGADYIQYRDQAMSFTNIAAYLANTPQDPVRIAGPKGPPIDMARPIYVTGNFFETVETHAALGRVLSPEDAHQGAAKVVVLSDEGWRRYFARDPHILGQAMFFQGNAFTIVGVTPPSLTEVFRVSPEGWNLPILGVTGPLFFIPMVDPSRFHEVSLIGRLKPGISLGESQADLSRITSQLSVQKGTDVSISVKPANVLDPLLLIVFALPVSLGLAGVAVVLMIACDNIAILLLAKIAARRREIGIRLALGASRTQLIRQLLAENLMLSALGGVGAMIVALMTARIIERLPLPVPIPDAFSMTFNWRVLLFAALTSFAATILFGMRPALQAVNKDVVASLNPGSSPGDSRHATVRSTLVITQVTVCAALLITAAVLVRSQKMPTPADRGFAASRVLVASVNFQGTGNQFGFYEKLLPRFENTPGIVSAAVAEVTPAPNGADGSAGSAGLMTVRDEIDNREYQVQSNNIAGQYFRTLSIPILEGRDFGPNDQIDSPPVAIVNDTLAQRLWPRQISVGRWLKTSDGSSVEIVGLVHDANTTADGSPLPFLYSPLAQQRGAVKTKLLVRSAQKDATAITALVQGKVAEVDSNSIAYNMHTVEQEFDLAFLPNRLGEYIAGVPGALAFLLGIIGTYGTMALLVAQRRREIGIRIALGADPSAAVALMLRQGLKWTVIGLGLGTAGAFSLVYWLSRYFNGMSQFDAPAFAAGVIVLAVTAATACYIPAKRASRIEPLDVLRQD